MHSLEFAPRFTTQNSVFIQIALEQISKLEELNCLEAYTLINDMKYYIMVFESWQSSKPFEEDRNNVVSDFISKATESMRYLAHVSQKKLESTRPVRSI